jgi:hypothetical protein
VSLTHLYGGVRVVPAVEVHLGHVEVDARARLQDVAESVQGRTQFPGLVRRHPLMPHPHHLTQRLLTRHHAGGGDDVVPVVDAVVFNVVLVVISFF